MDALLDPGILIAYARSAETWLRRDVLVLGTLIQLAVILTAYVAARLLAPRLKAQLSKLGRRRADDSRIYRIAKAVAPLTLPLVWLALQWLSVLVADRAGWPNHLITIAVSLLTAWVVIRFTTSLVRDPAWARFVALTAWFIAALNIVGLLDETIAMLDSVALTVGGLRLSILTVVKGVLALALLLWVATTSSHIFERRISSLPNLTPSVQVLFSKLLKIVLITLAIVIALSSVGIDLTAFAVFSGAVGVGIGFGLQKVVSNLISGVILLLDRSIKPGDVISVGDTFGWINSLGARYASVITRDGTEWLIPNEDLITQQVVNWSYSDKKVRIGIPVGVSYNCDVPKAMALCLEAAAETPRVLDNPRSACLLTGFGDSSVDLELRFWIEDPQGGVSNVKSQVLLRIWEKFHAADVEIPFPQRDLNLKRSAALDRVLEAMERSGPSPDRPAP